MSDLTETVTIDGPSCEPELPICDTNCLDNVVIVHAYDRDGGVIGLGERYHPSMEAAQEFIRGIEKDLPEYRWRAVEYSRIQLGFVGKAQTLVVD